MTLDLARFGGSLGTAFRRDGHETLRVLAADGRFHVVWRLRDAVIAHLAADSAADAELLWQYFEPAFGSAASRIRPAPRAIDRVHFDDVSEYDVRARRGRRQCVVGSSDQPTFLRFLAVHDVEVLGAAELADLDDGRRLAALVRSLRTPREA